jgi:SAM-dependent methyltransferase
MREVDKQKMFDRYTQRISKFGHGAAALGEPRERQAFYFDFLSKVDGLGSSDSIIDIGCGYGDLGSYLRSCGWRGEYVGVDINPQLIEEGRTRYGDDAHLIVADIQETPLQRVADWCFCCAALTSATEGLPFVEHLESMLQLMWASSRKGLVFNLLSPLADYTNPIHARPPFDEVLNVITRLTNRFTIRHDYMPYEYAVYAYKDNAIDPGSLVFAVHRTHLAQVTERWRRHRA